MGGGLLSLSLSLSLLALFSTLKFLKSLFLGFCALFVILSLLQKGEKSKGLKAHLIFLDTSLTLSMTANASLRAVFAKTAWLSINLAFFLLFGLPRSLCSLAMTDKENALCHFARTARQKFKFFTQNSTHFVNSRHFVNSTHFITLSQNLSPTQGFFIFLPQVFAQFLLINSLQRSSYGRQDTKAPF